MRYPEDPHIVVGQTLVHIGAVSLLQDLIASGHRVALDDDIGLTVEPPDDLHEYAWALDTFEEDLLLLLRAGGVPVH